MSRSDGKSNPCVPSDIKASTVSSGKNCGIRNWKYPRSQLRTLPVLWASAWETGKRVASEPAVWRFDGPSLGTRQRLIGNDMASVWDRRPSNWEWESGPDPCKCSRLQRSPKHFREHE